MAIQIVQGENFTMRLRVSDKKSGKPWNFTGFDGATAYFYPAEGTDPIAVTGVNPETNLLQFDGLPADSEAILAGDSISFQYKWIQSGLEYIEIVDNQLTVLEQLF